MSYLIPFFKLQVKGIKLLPFSGCFISSSSGPWSKSIKSFSANSRLMRTFEWKYICNISLISTQSLNSKSRETTRWLLKSVLKNLGLLITHCCQVLCVFRPKAEKCFCFNLVHIAILLLLFLWSVNIFKEMLFRLALIWMPCLIIILWFETFQHFKEHSPSLFFLARENMYDVPPVLAQKLHLKKPTPYLF